MAKFQVKITRQSFTAVTIEVEADNAVDADDMATDLFYQDDGCHGIRDRMEHDGGLLDIKVVEGESAPVVEALRFSKADVF